jgi:hypothetical protein
LRYACSKFFTTRDRAQHNIRSEQGFRIILSQTSRRSLGQGSLLYSEGKKEYRQGQNIIARKTAAAIFFAGLPPGISIDENPAAV